MVGGRRRDPFMPLLWYAAATEGVFTVQMIVSPDLFDAPAYATARAIFVPLTILFALGGGAALLAVADLVGKRPFPSIFLIAAAPLVPWSVGFALAGSITGTVSYAVVAVFLIFAAFSLWRRRAVRSRPYVLMVGLMEIVFGGAMIVSPAAFRDPAHYAELRSYLWLFGPSFVVVGTALCVAEVRRWEQALGAVALLAAVNLSVLVNIFAVTRQWTGTLSYGIMLLVLLVTVARRSADRIAPLLLIGIGGIVALWDLLVWYLPSPIPSLVPQWTMLRPSSAASLVIVAAGYAVLLMADGQRHRIAASLLGLLGGAIGAVTLALANTRSGLMSDPLVLMGWHPGDWSGALAAETLVVCAGLVLMVVAIRPSKWSPHLVAVLATAVAGVSALNVIAYMLESSALLDLYGQLAMRLHAALALAVFSMGLLAWALNGIARGSIGARVFASLYGLLVVVVLRSYVEARTLVAVTDLHSGDPRIGTMVADSSDATKTLLALGAVVIVWTGLVLTRTVTLPLGELYRAIQRAASGERRVQVNSDRSDEIGAVIRAFDRMSLEIADAHEALRARSAELAEKNEDYRAMLQAQSDLGEAVIMIENGHIADWNEALPRIAGHSDVELRALPDLLELVPADLRGQMREVLRSRVGETYQSELSLVSGAGGTVELEMSVIPLRSEAHRQMAILRDVTERKRAQRRLERLALHDDLTGLANRTLFVDRVERTIRAAGLAGDQVGLLYLDLDRFKEINDAFGHAAGDALLREIGGRLVGALGPSDTVARFGGDEFAVLHPGSGDIGALSVVAERVTAALRPALPNDGHPVYVDASIGIVSYPDHGRDAATLLRHADVAMYAAKRNGSGWAVYAIENDPNSQQRLSLLADLREALEREELTLRFQPQVRLDGGEVCGAASVEALARWHHPERGDVPPSVFIPLAEETGLIEDMDEWLLGQALGSCARWQAEGLDSTVSVNLSMRTLRRPNIERVVLAELEAVGLAPSSLIVEVTESWMMQDPRKTEEVLTRLAARGVRVSIDDFGTGYSSLVYLQRLPVHELKIDASFVRAMLDDTGSEAIVRSTIQLGHALRLLVVAEGVENEAQRRALAARRCDLGQGFAIARPLKVDDLIPWLRERRAFGPGALAVAQ